MNTSNTPINFENLKSPNSPKFLPELRLSLMNLTHDQEKIFFPLLLSYFDESTENGQNLKKETGKAILSVIYKIISQPNRQINFKRFISKLPITNEKYSNNMFDILYVLAQRDPNLFNKNISLKFKHLIKINPVKSIVILALLASNFEMFEDPWPMIDLLFSYKGIFVKNCPLEYVTILVTLCKKDYTFLEGRASHCWTRLCSILENAPLQNENLIQITYYGICTLIDLKKDSLDFNLIPNEIISRHLQITNLQPCVVSFYLRVPPSPDDPNIATIIATLLELSQEAVKPTFILIVLANDPTCASLIVQNENWLSKKIPTQIDTIKLLMAVMKHENLRPIIMRMSEIIDFLKNSVKEDNSFMSAILMIIRRLQINEDFITKLCRNGIIQMFVDKANTMVNFDQLNTMMILFDTFGNIFFQSSSPDYNCICDFLIKSIKKKNEISLIAAKVATHFAIHPTCLSFFRKKGVAKYIEEANDFPQLQKTSRKFLKLINEA